MTEEEKVDYLDVDDSIPGQNYCCLSFVSPEDLIESKEAWKVSKFLQSVCKDKDMEFKKIMEQYKDFCYKFQDDLQKDFDQQNDFKTNIRGVKVRGVYNTQAEATSRAKKLQTTDSDFHVFVGQVGYWLPWNPCADKIEDEQFMNSQLNDMMEKYKENTINKDVFYEEQKREKVKAAREEALKKKKEKLESEKELEDKEPVKEEPVKEEPVKEEPVKEELVKEEPVKEEPVKEEPDKEPVKEEPVKEDVKEEPVKEEPVKEEVKEETEPEEINEIIGNDKVDDDIKESLESVDPWMANKLKEQ